MDAVINAPVIGRGDFIVCVGGGRRGAKGATIAREAGARAEVEEIVRGGIE